MPSPFPGMDPYLEAYWGDVHSRLVLYACDALQPKLPTDLISRVEERVFVETPDEGASVRQEFYPDVRVVERPGRGGGVALAEPEAEVGVAVADPLLIESRRVQRRETFVEIRDVKSGNQVVTVIEVLSPSNKKGGEGRKLYRKKQKELQRGRVNLVELDLLRRGRRVLGRDPEHLAERYRTAYQASVWRGVKPGVLELYPLELRQRLPGIRIPLRPTDADVVLDLQSLVDQAYRNGRYEVDIDYARDPMPALGPADAAWADALLRERGARRTPGAADHGPSPETRAM